MSVDASRPVGGGTSYPPGSVVSSSLGPAWVVSAVRRGGRGPWGAPLVCRMRACVSLVVELRFVRSRFDIGVRGGCSLLSGCTAASSIYGSTVK